MKRLTDRDMLKKIAELELQVFELQKRRAEEAEKEQRPHCGTCRYFHARSANLGECRRYAMRPSTSASSWHDVRPDMWCGEWDPSGWSSVEREAYRARNSDDPGFTT